MECSGGRDRMFRIISCEKESLIVLTYTEIHFDHNHYLHSRTIFLVQIITMKSGLRRFDPDPEGIVNQVMTCINNKMNMSGKYGVFSIIITNFLPCAEGPDSRMNFFEEEGMM